MPALDPPELVTLRLSLRLVSEDDVQETTALMTPEVAAPLSSWRHPMKPGDVRKKVAEALTGAAARERLDLAIRRRDDGRLVGWVGLFRLPGATGVAQLGYWLGTEFQGSGYMAEAAAAALAAAARFLELVSVEAAVKEDNVASVAVLRKLGMSMRGHRIEHMHYRDTDELCAVYAIDL